MKKHIYRFILLSAALVFALPIALTVLNSFGVGGLETGAGEVTEAGSFSLKGYRGLLIENHWFYRNFWNSVFYSVVITLVNIVVSVPAAYAFRQTKFRGKNLLFTGYIVLMMMPLQVTLLPNYIGLRDLKLLDTPFAILLPAFFAPFSVFLMTQYMRGIEDSMVEAALLETKSVFVILMKVVLPQIKACAAALFLFVFAENWNMAEQPDIYLKGDALKPFSVLLFAGGRLNVAEVLAGSVIFMLPIVILYLYFHDSLEDGLESMKL